MSDRLATLKREIRGHFGTWDAGTRVIVTSPGDVIVTIARAAPLDRTFLNNVMTGVPTDALDFDK